MSKQQADRKFVFIANGELLISFVENTLRDLSGFKLKRTIDFDINLYGGAGSIKFSAKPIKK